MRAFKAAAVDKPKERKRRDPRAELRQTKQYVQRMAKEFGWQIVKRPK